MAMRRRHLQLAITLDILSTEQHLIDPLGRNQTGSSTKRFIYDEDLRQTTISTMATLPVLKKDVARSHDLVSLTKSLYVPVSVLENALRGTRQTFDPVWSTAFDSHLAKMGSLCPY